MQERFGDRWGEFVGNLKAGVLVLAFIAASGVGAVLVAGVVIAPLLVAAALLGVRDDPPWLYPVAGAVAVIAMVAQLGRLRIQRPWE